MKLGYGGGCLCVLGLPFLLVGMGCLANTLGFIGLPGAEGKTIPWFVGLPIGTMFTIGGTGVVFGRGGLEIDAMTQKVTTWWGIPFLSLGRREIPLSAFDEVRLRSQSYLRNRQKLYWFIVQLKGESQNIEVKRWSGHWEAKKQAEEIAQLCGLPLRDRVSDKEASHNENLPGGWRRVE